MFSSAPSYQTAIFIIHSYMYTCADYYYSFYSCGFLCMFVCLLLYYVLYLILYYSSEFRKILQLSCVFSRFCIQHSSACDIELYMKMQKLYVEL